MVFCVQGTTTHTTEKFDWKEAKNETPRDFALNLGKMEYGFSACQHVIYFIYSWGGGDT